jgi:hypothetical protein
MINIIASLHPTRSQPLTDSAKRRKSALAEFFSIDL